MKDPTTLKSLLLLADTLPHITALSLVFQRRDVNLGMVKTTVDKTIKMLQTRKTQNGPWQLKYSQISSDINLTNTLNPDFNTKVKEPFLTQLITNIRYRFVDTDIIDQLAVMDFSGTSDDLPALYVYTEMYDIAAHFSMDPEDLQLQWQDLIQFLNTMPTQDRSMTSLLHLLHNSDDTGLKNMYPLIYRLFSIATTLPLSTAEVERVVSQVKLIKTSHRSSIKTKTLNHLLNIKLNCDKTMFEHVLQPTVTNFFQAKNRRLNTMC